MRKVFQIVGAIALVCLLAVGGCQLVNLNAAQPDPVDTARWEQVEQQTEATPAVVTKEVLSGSAFNAYFPDATDGYERIYTQEKKGFAEAKLKLEGLDVAMLSVSDTAANPSAVGKYTSSTEEIQGYPAATIGSTTTGLLVADRIQVKVLSRDETFTADDREAWLGKFDLAGLAGLVQ
ncbi:MAG: hypothetical protein AAFZ80_10605 [Cyanobacteria bacterium P01_A01_bin.105]